MISILPSEGLAPAQSAPKQNKMSEPSSKSDETSFSSLVSRDAADNSADPNPDAPRADTALAPQPSQPEPSDTPARPKLGPALSTGEQIDPALAETENLLAPQLEGDARQKMTPTQTGAAFTIDETVTPVVATTDTPSDGSIENDADYTIQTKRAQAAILPGAASAESLQTVKPEFDAATRQSHPSNAEIEVHIETSPKSGLEPADPKIQATLPDASAPAADDTLKVIRQQDSVDLSGPDVKLAQLASDADLTQSATKNCTCGHNRQRSRCRSNLQCARCRNLSRATSFDVCANNRCIRSHTSRAVYPGCCAL